MCPYGQTLVLAGIQVHRTVKMATTKRTRKVAPVLRSDVTLDEARAIIDAENVRIRDEAVKNRQQANISIDKMVIELNNLEVKIIETCEIHGITDKSFCLFDTEWYVHPGYISTEDWNGSSC